MILARGHYWRLMGSSRWRERSMLALYVGYRCDCWLGENGPKEEEGWFSRQLAENRGSVRWQEALMVTWRFGVVERLIAGGWTRHWKVWPWGVLVRGRKWISGRDVAWKREGYKKNSKEFLWCLKRNERRKLMGLWLDGTRFVSHVIGFFLKKNKHII